MPQRPGRALAYALLVLVILFKNGPVYFASLTVWLAYLILLTSPWFTGRSLATANSE